MDIINTALSNLRHSEYITYMRSYLNIFDRNDPDILGVEDEFNALTAKIDAIEDIYKLDRASELTAVIADLDIQRDRGLMSLSSVIGGYMGHYDQSKVNDASRLNTRLNVYGGAGKIAAESLQGQTASLDNLIYDFQNEPALQAAVTALGLGDWISQLKIVNDNLRSAYDERIDEKGDAPADKIKDLRNEGNDLFYDLRDMMAAHARIAGYAAPYDAVIADINALSDMYNQTLAHRSGTMPDPEDNGGDADVGNRTE